MRLRALSAVAVAAILSAPSVALGAQPPYRVLGSFDMIAVAAEDQSTTLRTSLVLVVTRKSASRNEAATFLTQGGSVTHRFGELAWSPGAASLATKESTFSNGAPVDNLKLYEFPTGPVASLGGQLNAVRAPTANPRVLRALRWTASGTTQSVRILTSVSQAGVVSIRPDGSDAQVIDTRGASGSLFHDGRREATPSQQPAVTVGGDLKFFQDIVIRNTPGTADKRLTNTLLVTEHDPQLSPDDERVAYLRGQELDDLAGLSGDGISRLRVVSVLGTGDRELSPSSMAVSGRPAWSPNSSRIAFVGRIQEPGESLREPDVIYSVKPDGTDLVRHTDPHVPLRGPLPVGLGPLTWGTTCALIVGCGSALEVVQPGPAGFQIQSQPQLSAAASIGFLVERYDARGTLRRVTRVPFGTKRRGDATVRWNLRINGRTPRPGRYRITLRALARGVPLDRSEPVDLVVPRQGRPILQRARDPR